jgi:hypothetical protein
MIPDPTCPLCLSTSGKTLYRLAEGFDTRQCTGCGFIFLSPRPSPAYLRDHYTMANVYDIDALEAEVKPLKDGVFEDRAKSVKDRVDLIERSLIAFPTLSVKGQAICFGAGDAAMVTALQQLGYEAIDMGLKKADLSLYQDDALSFLTIFDLLERLLDPKAFLTLARGKLKSNGALLAVVPNFNALERYLLGPRSRALTFPEHVNQFTKTSLSNLFKSAGLDVLYVGSPPPYGVMISLGFRGQLKHLAAKGHLKSTLEAVSYGLGFIKRHVIYPLPNAFVEHTGLLGQSLLILAQKSR